ncbi:MAG: hypothetical protein K0S44_268 [Bacteroidetes bacterium]|jgi:tetratricopeptide (TPR) repeat protein|nr:hypothetical protein [Bacteroidota bacterium]
MDKFIIYSVEIALSLALFYSAYWIFLKNETFFKLNRFYLIFSVVISLLTPLLNITIGGDSFITKNLISPIELYEQSMFQNTDGENIPTRNGMIPQGNDGNIAGNKVANIDHETGKPDPEQTASVNSSEASSADTKTNWLTVALVIYLIGASLFLIRFIANFILIFSYTIRHKQEQIFGMNVIRFEKNISPFSFLNLIFIRNIEYPEAELTKIISHEKVHIRQKHSIDLILFELLFVFQWFNPFVWLYKRAIKITHEYLADQGTLKSGVDLPDYQYSLLNQVLRENNFEIASNYNLSIKKRIEMMMKKRSPKLSALKLTIALPILVFLFVAFAFTSKKDIGQTNIERNELKAEPDSTIKKVNVPIEYLKMLEGEYVSSNDPNRVRKIKFVEVLGVLVGNDAGYRYKIIPLGDGKFINPDDGASLIFDTKDKNAISLLLFGKINLKKVKESGDFPKKSVAFSLANTMAKDGIPAALSNYKEVKNSGNYDLNESEMNIVGYQLLESGKTKEAAAIFKLSTEAFPNSFNVYDSYGEVLMALGDKTQAIENYKKSVRLNPGSRNGLKVLKEAGIDTDTLIKKIKLPDGYLKSLEGEYKSTNEPHGVRIIKFIEEEGVLFGNDNGYRYDLIPMGEGKFINPDDGASLVFDTKNKNAITLLLFGTVNLKKVSELKESDRIKKVEVPIEYLKQLEGEYHSTDDPKGVRKIIFTVEDGVLYGNDNGYRYKLVPGGDGKFTNPDDGAPLVFDTKDKNAITLLLFGRINLKKVK